MNHKKTRFLIIFFLSLLEALSCYAQESAFVIGKWKVVAINNTDFYHNFENDSTTLADTYKQQLQNYKQDMVQAIKNVKSIINMTYANSEYIFARNNSYQFFANNELIDSGKFIIQKKIIKTTSTKSIKDDVAKEVDEITIIKQEDNSLTISMQMEDDVVVFYLKRTF